MGAGASVPVAEKEKLMDLLNTIRTTTGKDRYNALLALRDDYCNNSEYKEILCLNEEIGLLSTLKMLSENLADDNDSLNSVIYSIMLLSAGTEACCLKLASKEYGLFPILLQKFSSPSTGIYFRNATEMVIGNCSRFEDCHSYLLSSEVNWLHHLENRLKTKSDEYLSHGLFSCFISNMKNENVHLLINLGIPERILEMLATFTDKMDKYTEKSANDNFTTVPGQAIPVITYLSKTSVGSSYLKEYFDSHSNMTSFFFALLPSSSVFGIYATIIIANVYGRDENNEHSKALLDSHPDVLPFLLETMDAMMNYDLSRQEVQKVIEKGFYYGLFKLTVIAVALRNLSISDENKRIMKQSSKLIMLACQGIKLFIDNASECKAKNPNKSYYDYGGGGGKDYITVDNLLEVLVQLSFTFEDINELKAAFSISASSSSSSAYDVKIMMEELLALPSERKFSFEGKQFAKQLLAKLDPPLSSTLKHEEIREKEGLQEKEANPQHVMLSYSWSANKSLVIGFGNKLKEMGYDVWRDEEGSHIMHGMSGDIIETMGEAIEKSYVVIIFVSPEYKESTNCRNEAGYARARAGNSDLKLIYMMMNEQYHTGSRPRKVDGWLGFMIGSDLWYPLWDENKIESAASSVAALIGNNAKLSNKPKSITLHSSPMKKVLSVEASEKNPIIVIPNRNFPVSSSPTVHTLVAQAKLSKEADLDAAYACLEKKKSFFPKSLLSFLEELSIEEAKDLKDTEVKILLSLASMLKPIPAENFLLALRLDKL
jgi:hypothetical protein